jgi:Uma2 family endonuclease
MAVSPLKRRFTTVDYHTMLQAGILTEEDRVELIEGEILAMTPIGSRHAGCVNGLVRVLSRSLGDRALLGIQNPITLDDLSEPQPDLAVLRPRGDDYRGSHPGPDDVLLLIEVAETSTAQDRALKNPLYGRCGVAETWLVDLQGRILDVYFEPTADGYRTRRRLRPGDRVSPQAFPDLVLDVAGLLG